MNLLEGKDMKKNEIKYLKQLFHNKGKLPLCNQLTVISDTFSKYELVYEHSMKINIVTKK